MPSEFMVRKLSAAQREMLLAHIDTPLDVTTDQTQTVRQSLVKAGLLRGHPYGTVRPRLTMLTTDGRYAVGMILESYANALVQVGLLEQDNPLAALQALAKWKGTVRKIPEILPLTAVAALISAQK